MSNAINLALLPPLTIVDELSFEQILQEVSDAAQIENPSPSDPAYRVLLATSYRELWLRKYINDQARGLTLAFAVAGQLDHIGVTYYNDADGTPVIRLEGESDDNYRQRLNSSLDGLSVAGPDAAYEFHAKSAHADVKDVLVTSPRPVEVDLYILSRVGTGVPSPELLQIVRDYLEPRRPFTDLLRVNAARLVNYSVTASIIIDNVANTEQIRLNAIASLQAYVDLKNRLGARVVESGIHAALTVEAVQEVHLTGWTDITPRNDTAPFCESVTVTIGGIL